MIIVEGCDNTGKSTLISTLQKTFNIPAIRSGMKSPTYQTMLEYHHWTAASPTPLVLDRHPVISDFIYGNLLRNGSESNPILLTSVLESSYVIFAQPPFHIVAHTIDERDQMSGVTDQLARIYAAYNTLFEAHEPDQIYDYTKPNALNALITNVAHYLEKTK